MKVCFLLNHIPNPRMNKRISVGKQEGTAIVISVRRKSQNIWNIYHQDVEHIIFDMDMPDSSKVFQRSKYTFIYMWKALIKLAKIKPDVIYAESLDSLAIGYLFALRKKIRLVYEVADLRELFIVEPKSFQEKIKKAVMSGIEAVLFKKVDCLVITSQKFYEVHYKSLIPKEKVTFIPNVPDIQYFEDYRKKETGPFVIGFIGGIRYLNQMKLLVDASIDARVDVVFAGAGGTDKDYIEIKQYCSGKNNIVFSGKYDYATDIARLYGKIDCVYAVYDATNPNVCVALPNKLYEAIYCEVPIIVAKETYLSELVDAWGVGVSVDCSDRRQLVEAINLLKQKSNLYNKIVENCHRMKKEINNDFYREQVRSLFQNNE